MNELKLIVTLIWLTIFGFIMFIKVVVLGKG